MKFAGGRWRVSKLPGEKLEQEKEREIEVRVVITIDRGKIIVTP